MSRGSTRRSSPSGESGGVFLAHSTIPTVRRELAPSIPFCYSALRSPTQSEGWPSAGFPRFQPRRRYRCRQRGNFCRCMHTLYIRDIRLTVPVPCVHQGSSSISTLRPGAPWSRAITKPDSESLQYVRPPICDRLGLSHDNTYGVRKAVKLN